MRFISAVLSVVLVSGWGISQDVLVGGRVFGVQLANYVVVLGLVARDPRFGELRLNLSEPDRR